MNAWGALTIVLFTAIVAVCILWDRQADRQAAFRWEERFYQPHLRAWGRVIDVASRSTPEIHERIRSDG